MARRRLRSSDEGASPLASFLVAIGFFSMAFGSILVMVAHVGGHEGDGDAIAADGEAAGVLDLLTSTPGSPTTWSGAVPDRLGLREPDKAATLDMGKFSSVRTWGTADYDAARTALGIPKSDFYVRSYPVYTTASDAADTAVAGIRTAYVGDFEAGVEQQSSGVEGRTLDNLSLDYANALVDRAAAGLPGDKFQDTTAFATRNLAPRLAGFPYTVDVDTGVTNDGYWKVVNVQEYGAVGYLSPGGQHALTASNWAGSKYEYTAFTSGSLISEDTLVLGTFDLRTYGSGSSIKLNFTHWASGHRLLPTGLNPATDDYGYVSVRCVESCRTGDDLPATRGGNHFSNGTRSSFSATSIDLSTYHGEKIQVSLVWHSVVALRAGEGWFLGPLALKATTAGATKTLWQNNLDYSSTLYDALVVGSEADHGALDDSAAGGVFKVALREWIAEGGFVFGFGSDDASNGWLNPIFTTGSAARTTGAALLAQSDLSHPVLSTPHRVRPGDLAAAEKTYRPAANLRPVIVVQEQGAAGTVPLLAVSIPSASYDGVAVLSAYLPWKLQEVDREGLIVNMILYAKYNSFYLDYGAPGGVPYGGAVHSAGTTVLVNADDEGLGVLECEILAFVW